MSTPNGASPSVGRIVHYVSHGTPVLKDGTQAYSSQCRAAVITEVWYVDKVGTSLATADVGLCVLNPTGLFFHESCKHDEAEKTGGTWHWPERV